MTRRGARIVRGEFEQAIVVQGDRLLGFERGEHCGSKSVSGLVDELDHGLGEGAGCVRKSLREGAVEVRGLIEDVARRAREARRFGSRETRRDSQFGDQIPPGRRTAVTLIPEPMNGTSRRRAASPPSSRARRVCRASSPGHASSPLVTADDLSEVVRTVIIQNDRNVEAVRRSRPSGLRRTGHAECLPGPARRLRPSRRTPAGRQAASR